MKIPFDIKFRPQIESGEYKVETANGYPVRIYRWDFKDTEGTPIMGSYAFENGNGTEYCAGWTEKGRCNLSDIPDDYDLFIITPEPELNEFEEAIGAEIFDPPIQCRAGKSDKGRINETSRPRKDRLLVSEIPEGEANMGGCGNPYHYLRSRA